MGGPGSGRKAGSGSGKAKNGFDSKVYKQYKVNRKRFGNMAKLKSGRRLIAKSSKDFPKGEA